MIEIYLNDLLIGISFALDFVERELNGVANHHSKRVAYITVQLGKKMGYSDDKLLNLAASAAMHDNALSEYQQVEFLNNNWSKLENGSDAAGIHCQLGEKNMEKMPFYSAIRGAILYHHEQADGSGPFRKTAEETPEFAKLIHIADALDTEFDLSNMTDKKYQIICQYLKTCTDIIFDKQTVETFLKSFPTPESAALDLTNLEDNLKKCLPSVPMTYTDEEMLSIASIFSKIIDYKSSFTCCHSAGIAQKAMQMGEFYGWDRHTQVKLYLAGALHDVGKLMVSSDILEKPGKLTESEYQNIQYHAYGSYLILHPIRGLSELSKWAYLHHEKLDGSGYPFGKTGAELGTKERLMACLDIYQALIESRPYKEGMSHKEAMKILQLMGEKGQLDQTIIQDIDQCFS